ncbi:MAG: HEAT repeat domain-containing protein [Nitrospirae bacterium]|nr:HEAT repeat domain-containing protein [Nitrospirota bacterium]
MRFSDKNAVMITTSEKDIVAQLERMKDTDSAVRREAIESLTGVNDGRALYPLIKALQDEDAGIQQAAMDALMAFEDESAVYNVLPLLADRRVSVKNMAQEIVQKIGGYGIELIRLHIKDRDEDVRKMIADILGRIKRPEAVAMLLEMLEDPNSNVRSSAADGLGRMGDSSTVESLIELLDKGDWTALFAADALGRIGDKRAIRPLVELIRSSDAEMQIMGIEALARIGGEDAVDGLLETIDSVRPEAIGTAVKGLVRLTHGDIEKALDRFGREGFFKRLVEAMDNVDLEEPDVRKDFILAFLNADSPGSSYHILRLISDVDIESIEIIQHAADALEKLRDEDTLINALQDKSDICRMIAIRVLGLLRCSKVVPHLLTIFEEAEREIKLEILYTLGKTGGKDALDFLIDKLSYGEGHIREAAVDALGVMAVPEAIDPLLTRLQKEEYHNVIGKIAGALVEIGERHNSNKLFEGMISNLSSKNPSVREMVIKGLGTLKREESAEYVKGMLNDESWRVRRACLEALRSLNVKGLLEVLVIASRDEKDEVRMYVAQLLSEYREEESVNTLISLFSDSNDWIKYKAIEGVVELKAKKAIPYLMELAQIGEYTVQRASLWALGELTAVEAGGLLKNMSSHKNPEIRDTAIQASKKLNAVY